MTDRVRRHGSAFGRAAAAYLLLASGVACLRGTLPPREYYRLAPADSLAGALPSGATPPLSMGVGVLAYDTPGIYGTGALVYRVDPSAYGAYPSREWAIPLGEMLGAMTQDILQRHALTSGRVAFDAPASKNQPYEWRGTVREFDEVDGPSAVSASVSLAAQLVRVADDSVIWSGVVKEVEPVTQARSIQSVVAALSAASARAIARLADGAANDLRRLAAAGARER
jgi:uncharacterized lipoprotein YmbA